MARGQRDQDKEHFWRRMVQRWRHSGRSVRDFCAQQELSEASFYGWRRTLAQRDQRTAAAPPLPAFLPVQVVPTTPAPLELVLGNGRLLRVSPGFEAATLRQLLAVLEEPSC